MRIPELSRFSPDVALVDLRLRYERLVLNNERDFVGWDDVILDELRFEIVPNDVTGSYPCVRIESSNSQGVVVIPNQTRALIAFRRTGRPFCATITPPR